MKLYFLSLTKYSKENLKFILIQVFKTYVTCGLNDEVK